MQQSRTEYYQYIDAARSALMLLGVVLHASNIYSINKAWVISDATQNAAFDLLSLFIHRFRVPSFFLISGFFVHLSLRRFGTLEFLKRRLLRIGVPLVTVALTLNTVQTLLVQKDAWASVWSAQYWLGYVWVQHLWFLLHIMVYSFVTALLWRAVNSRQYLRKDSLAYTALQRPVAVEYILIFGLPLVTLLWRSLCKAVPAMYLQIGPFKPVELGDGAAYFAFGFLLFGWLRAHERFLRPSITFCVVWLSVVLLLGFAAITQQRPQGLGTKAAFIFAESLVNFGLVRFVLAAFRAYCNSRGRFFLRFTDSSYTIYLTHHLLVIAFGLLLISINISIFLKFAIVCLATWAVTLAFHHFAVRRSRWLGLLLNGKTYKPSKLPTSTIGVPLPAQGYPLRPARKRAAVAPSPTVAGSDRSTT